MKQKKVKERKTSYLAWDEYLRILNELKGDKIRLLVAFQGMCGLRISDVLNLTWGDIINTETVSIQEKKTGKNRRIYLNDDLRAIIKEEYNEQYTNIYCFRSKFANKPMGINWVNRKYKNIFESLNIDYKGNVSSHLFRKTFGRRYIELNDWSDKSMLILCDVFNHSSIQMTRIYLGIRDEEIKEVYTTLTL